jgi:hypothetical protein
MKSLKDQPYHTPDERRSNFCNPGLLCMIAACAMITLTSNEVSASAQSTQDNSTGVLLGVFHEGSQTDLKPIRELEKGLNKKFASIMWFTDWTTGFPAADAKRVSKAGYIPHIAWEPWSWEKKDLIKLQDILDGKWDTYIKTWAADAAKFKRPLLLRWAHEFNGDWYPWSVPKNGEDPQTYIKAYRYVHDIFNAAGAKNVQWIWCFNAASVPSQPWNAPLEAYPGDTYVDWVGIDGYNFSGTDSFKSIFKTAYTKALSSVKKPIMIAEFATAGTGPDKAKWIAEMANDLKTVFPAIRAITWFDINKEKDWRLFSSVESQNSAKKAFEDSYFLTKSSLFQTIPSQFSSYHEGYLKNLESSSPKKVLMKASASAFPDETVIAKLDSLWVKSTPLSVTSAKGEADLHAKVSLGYSQKSLFVRAEIADDFPMNNDKTGADIWNGDGLELCISLDKDADPGREFYGPKDFQIGISPGKPDQGIKPSIWAWGSLKKSPDGAVIDVQKTSSGYLIQAIIPWASLVSDFIPQKGWELGFDCAIDDADQGSKDRQSQNIWCGDGNFYANPSQWGILILE